MVFRLTALRREWLDDVTSVMAIKCTDDSVRSWLHVDILFLFVRPVFFANDVTIGRTLESEEKKFRELDLGNLARIFTSC